MVAATPAMARDGLPPAPPSTANPQDEAAPASASPAQAVPPSTPGQAPVDASASQGIIVKAERRFNTAQKTAAAITVRPSAEMLRQGRYELKNILEDVPGVVDGAAATVATSQGSGTGKNHFRQYWADFKLDLGPVEVTYIPAVRTWYQNATIVARGTVFNADQTILTPDDKFVTHELRIHSTPNDSKFSWQTGAMYYRNTLITVNNLYNRDLGAQADADRRHNARPARRYRTQRSVRQPGYRDAA
ncbi:hypothetical protein [Sphingomonas sp. PP-CC-3A-396]|uniref:hypothetical protein n=1 Tax=Sphingomonas sp. PP-CC-3A-396 TaxID=2135655 RepID=UPI0010501831|nr:hypothetical protein [Sphingomonas sp. PP-CC-3A-396]TCQ07137.1 hypothetical protein C8J40_10423 [Sphingomonas sp. PP-CC-3A-396]